MKTYNCEQGTEEWFNIKLGVPSAGSFSKVMAKGQGKTRKSYLYRLAGEILTGFPQETYSNKEMERGLFLEPFAREEYEFITGNEVEQVGFIKNGKCGCSPDGLVGGDGGIEIKSVIPSVHIEAVKNDKVPPEHKAQIQGCMMVSGRVWWDFVSYSPDINGKYIFIKRMERDELYIKELRNEIDMFLIDLKETVKMMYV